MEILDNWGEKNIKISSELSGEMTKSTVNMPQLVHGCCADKCPPNTFGGCGRKDIPTLHIKRRMSNPGLRKCMRSGYNSLGTLPVLVSEGGSCNRTGNMVLKSHIPVPRSSSRSNARIPGTETKMVPPRININRRVINRDREMSTIKRDEEIDICKRVQCRHENHVSGDKMSEDIFDNIIQEVNATKDKRNNSPRENNHGYKHQHDIPGIVNSDGAEYKINTPISFKKREAENNYVETKQKKVVFDNISCVNCKNCTGCKNCFGCVDCHGCMNCSDCVGCTHCKNCMGLKNRMHAHDEYDVRKSCSLDMKVMDEMSQNMTVEILMK